MQKLTFTQLTESEIRQMMLEVAKEAVELFHRHQDHSDRPPFTRKEAAIHLGVSLPTLDTLIKTGQIKSFNIGRSVRITWDELNRSANK